VVNHTSATARARFDHVRTMSIGNFVAFLRPALATISLTKEEAALFAGQSARAGSATEAAAKWAAPGSHPTSGGGLLQGMALLVQPPKTRGAVSSFARHRPL